ncbi:NAD(P) transhydrogenase subunit beta [Luteitalea sp. TBR-22]|uniref:NAD(P)(+) transhydrogenase (Re/Si-specific) subunit beta n=1 Tax=Luteitalea sp. TBR-22 TaxID=2802971 RepID=UPI001AF66872|nr:NAD(P)(+) transhydrogenase (Re/Si-specific) subunit beta [Luteitalea sp. TBR-22]BCS35373.1 NAD(P) transhydrogenase subunit beta [Luteitalea sp. TBR-22]
MSPQTIDLVYLVSAALFIFSLKWMSDPKTARNGVFAGVAAMALAVAGTLLRPEITANGYVWIGVAVVLGTIVGVPLSWVPLTAVPQRTALSHAFGGLAAGLVGIGKFYLFMHEGDLTAFRTGAIVFEVALGLMTCTGSLVAAGKLQEVLPTRPVTYPGQNVVNFSLIGAGVLIGILLVVNPAWTFLFPALIVLALVFGVLLVMPIGGADMPTVISLLNSYAGLAAVAMGFVLENKLLIVAGALDGSSGLILSIIMCRAMNRSFTNVLFGAFGQVQAAAAAGEQKVAKSATIEDAAQILENADTVVIVPGYGMAVAQAQHRVRDVYEALTKKGVNVRFAVHPVAGRMPGHMNVLLAEAEIPYDRLVEMDDINPEMSQVDVCVILGANDVVNPAARHDKSSPIYGMPIIDADKARTVLANKRSMNPGFAGIENELYYAPNTLMIFGDSKVVMGDIAKALAGESGMH